MSRLVRLVALAAAISVAGLSSSLALCVAACTEETASQSATHACHDESAPRVLIKVETGSCRHTPATVDSIGFARDSAPPLFATGNSVANLLAPVLDRNHSTLAYRGGASPPRPVVYPPVLRI